MGSHILSTERPRSQTESAGWERILKSIYITLTFARAIGEFGATLMMAYYPRTLPVQIWRSFLSDGLDAAFPVAVMLVGVALGALLVINAFGSNPWRR